MAKKEIILGVDGTIRHVYSEDLEPLSKELGQQTIRRASHVEPTGSLSSEAWVWLMRESRVPINQIDLPEGWWADMLPVYGPVLGPFSTRQEALDAEVVWLSEHHIPAPQ